MKQHLRSGALGLLFATPVLFLLPALETGFAQSNPPICAINMKPPSVAVLDTQRNSITASIPIDKNPTAAVFEPNGRLLYVLHDGWSSSPNEPLGGLTRPKQASSLSIIDISAKTVVRKIPLGHGVTAIEMTEDGRHLVCLGNGKPGRGKPKSNTELGAITVLAAPTGQLVFSSANWRWVQQAIWTTDFSRIIVLGVREFANKNYAFVSIMGAHLLPRLQDIMLAGVRPSQHALSVLNGQGEILNQVDLPRWKGDPYAFLGMKMAFSKDENWLYLLDPGEPSNDASENRNAVVMVVDLRSGKLSASQEVGSSPSDLIVSPTSGNAAVLASKSPTDKQGHVFRIKGSEIIAPEIVVKKPRVLVSEADPGGFWAMGEEEIAFFPDWSGPANKPISLKSRDAAASGSELLTGDVQSSVSLPKKRRVAVTTSDHKLGVLNSSDNRLEHVVPIGRSGVRAAKKVGEAFSVPWPIVVGSYMVARRHPLQTQPAIVGPHEQFLYVLDTDSKAVTVVDLNKGSVVENVAVGSDCKGLVLTPDGKYICAVSRTKLTIFSTESNTKQVEYEYPPDAGHANAFGFVDEAGNIALLFDKSLRVWNIKQTKIEATIQGLSSAKLLACPRREKG